MIYRAATLSQALPEGRVAGRAEPRPGNQADRRPRLMHFAKAISFARIWRLE